MPFIVFALVAAAESATQLSSHLLLLLQLLLFVKYSFAYLRTYTGAHTQLQRCTNTQMCLCISVRLKTALLDVRLCACMQFPLSLFFACLFFVGVVAVTAAALTVAVSAINARTHTHFHSTDRSITRFHTLMCCDYCLTA